MFRNAHSIAKQYTFPVVISQKTVGGVCSTMIGAFVVINQDGWIMTAGHIIIGLSDLMRQERETRERINRRAQIESDVTISGEERARMLAEIGPVSDDDIERVSSWWGADGVNLVDGRAFMPIDFGVGRLDPYNPDMVATYPTIKDPARDFEPGTSLCKLGYPFHSIEPVWDEAQSAFVLPPGSVPPPQFPIDGIFTRTAVLVVEGHQTPFPLMWLETSSPGLRGQSGGPIFDTQGSIWALQCNTAHYPLGFNPEVPGSGPEHQFLNVGRGVHARTILGYFQEFGVSYQISAY